MTHRFRDLLALEPLTADELSFLLDQSKPFQEIQRHPLKKLATLRGKTVIVDAPNTAYAFQLYEILKRNGLNRGDYNVKIVGATLRIALRTQRADSVYSREICACVAT